MGTFAPIVDYLSANNILLNATVLGKTPPALGVTNAAIILPQFLTSFGYTAADVENSWIEYVPGAIGVADPWSREQSGRLVHVALSNPSYKRTLAHVSVPQSAGAMRVSIIDGRGRLVRNLSAASSETTIVWDGLNLAGTPVSTGNYFVKITVGTLESTGSIVVSR
jgi:hypothetical protein